MAPVILRVSPAISSVRSVLRYALRQQIDFFKAPQTHCLSVDLYPSYGYEAADNLHTSVSEKGCQATLSRVPRTSRVS